MIYSIFAALTVVLVSFIGIIFTSNLVKKTVTKYLQYLVTFSAGIFLFTAFNLFRESLEISTPSVILGGVFLGFILLFFLEKLLPESHHHHGEDCNHYHEKRGAIRMLVGDAFHKITDGIIIVPAFFVSFTVGVITTLSILVHEVIHNISEYFVLINAGYSPRQAILRNAGVSTAIFIGVIIGLLINSTGLIQALLLSFSSGVFIYLVVHDLAPVSVFRKSSKEIITHAVYFILGLVIFYVISIFLPH